MRSRWILPLVAVLLAVTGLAVAGPETGFELFGADPDKAQVRQLNSDEKLLARIQSGAREEVAALGRDLALERDPDRIREMQTRIVETKKNYRIRFLEALAASAATRGDVSTRDEALRQIDLIRTPPVRHYATPNRPVSELHKPLPLPVERP